MILTRRKLIGGIGLLIAAPAVVRAESLMRIKAVDPNWDAWLRPQTFKIMSISAGPATLNFGNGRIMKIGESADFMVGDLVTVRISA